DINIRRSEIESLAAASTREKNLSPNLSKYSLSNLPLDTQNVYSILLTVPFGVFLLVILRNIIGIKTFGTFMPILIALSFRETQLLSGLILFTLLVTLGLAIRFYLERLKLLLVPRLASVLIIVIMLMLVMSILSHNLGIESGLSVALFPMVIITMTIERMSIVWEEKGSQDAIYQGIGSLVAAAVAFQFMSNDIVEHLITVFPEILFIILSLTLILGRYTGYRLLELQRFKVLVNR
ncbi:MAG TPA: 7TM domain-containing protein, partial [Gammaproteobacteria bacterium]